MKENEEYHPLDLLKQAPTELGREQVAKMISTFPIVPPPTDWSSFINLNSILMTSIGTIILAGTIGFFSGESSANTTEIRQYQIEHTENDRQMEDFENSMVSEENTVLDTPPQKGNESVPQTPEEKLVDRDTSDAVTALGPGLTDSTELPPTMSPREIPPLPTLPDSEDRDRIFDLKGFTGVKLAGSHDVRVQKGAFSVTASGDNERLDKLEIEVRGDVLHISSKNENWNWSDSKGKGDVRIEVSLPELDLLSISGSGNMSVGGFSGLSSLEVNLSGSGNLTADGDLDVNGNIDVSLAGSGDITLRGSARSVDISIAGSGDVTAKDLSTTSAEVSIAGSGDVSITCTDDLDVSIAGSGDVDYYGSPRVKESILGSGDVSGH